MRTIRNRNQCVNRFRIKMTEKNHCQSDNTKKYNMNTTVLKTCGPSRRKRHMHFKHNWPAVENVCFVRWRSGCPIRILHVSPLPLVFACFWTFSLEERMEKTCWGDSFIFFQKWMCHRVGARGDKRSDGADRCSGYIYIEGVLETLVPKQTGQHGYTERGKHCVGRARNDRKGIWTRLSSRESAAGSVHRQDSTCPNPPMPQSKNVQLKNIFCGGG